MASNGDDEKMAEAGDIEMQEKGPLIDGDEVKIVQPNHKDEVKENGVAGKVEFSGLTKEELMVFANDPFWKKVRLVLFILFWLVWIGMLVAAVIIIVYAPKCPKRPKLEFWQKKTAYRVDPFAFKDKNGDGIGDINGLIEEIPYLKDRVGAGYIILDPIFKGQFSVNKNLTTDLLGLTTNFKEMASSLGKIDDFKRLLKVARKIDIEIVLTINPNCVGIGHPWFVGKKKYFITNAGKASNWKGRNGRSAWGTIDGSKYYTSMGLDKTSLACVDLNLTSSEVINEMKGILEFWMDLGVRGFLFTDAAFYVENFNDDTVNTLKTGSGPFFAEERNGQIFQEGSVTFLKEMRKVVDNIKLKTDKSRLLMVEAGDVGYGLEIEDDRSVKSFSTTDGAHMIVTYEFLKNRGWKVPSSPRNMESRIQNYMSGINSTNWKDIAYTTATPSHLRNGALPAVAAMFLLPGNPIVYYGSELNLNYGVGTKNCDYNQNVYDAAKLPYYPQNKRSIVDANLPFPNTMEGSVYNHLPMAWCPDGCFSNITFVKSDNFSCFQPSSNVLKVTAVGQKQTVFQLYKQLAVLRKSESLLFGDFKWISDPIYKSGNIELQEVFSRAAEGFNTYVVVIMHRKKSEGSLISLSETCLKVTPELVYPTNANLPIGKEIESKAINIHTPNSQPSLHVFKCAK